MRIYKEKDIEIPQDLNLTELLHQSAGNIPVPESHLIAKDNLTNRSLTIGELRSRAGRIANGLHKSLSHLKAIDGLSCCQIASNT
jgi:4-coumarate--CoA ligase